jgi:hypothetical protein
MEELGFNLEALGSAALAFAVLIAWLQSTRTRLKETEEDLERVQHEYISHLKAEKERDKLIQAELALGRQLQQTTIERWREIETQKIPTPAEIDSYIQSPSSDA